MTEPIRTATCSCGGLRVVVTGAPLRVSMCHCHACQRRTGSLFGAQGRWPRARAAIDGTSTVWRRTGDEGHACDFHFCPTCGATVWYVAVDQPDVVAVPAGAFADRDFPMPQISMYDDRRHPWLDLPAHMARD